MSTVRTPPIHHPGAALTIRKLEAFFHHEAHEAGLNSPRRARNLFNHEGHEEHEGYQMLHDVTSDTVLEYGHVEIDQKAVFHHSQL